MNDTRRQLDYLFDDGETFEICLIGTSTSKHKLWGDEFAGKGAVVAGWFDDKDKAVEIIQRVEKEVSPSGVYCTLNPCQPALLGRANNRLKVVKSRTSDKEIAAIKHVLIDVDPRRPSGVSASDIELAQAAELSNLIYKELTARGWGKPMCAHSGNGYHLVYKVSDAYPEIIKGLLATLNSRFSTPSVDVDTTVFNPARLVKVYGTTARKGEDMPDRPHRMSTIKSYPANPVYTPADFLIPFQPEPEEPKRKGADYAGGSLNVRDYLARYGVECAGEKSHGSSTLFLLEHCIFDSTHTNNEAAIGQCSDGKLFYQCFHNSCNSMTWGDARQIISGSDRISDNVSNVSNVSNAQNVSRCQQNVSRTSAERQHLESISQAKEEKLDVYATVKGWVKEYHGTFSTYDIDRDLGLFTREEKNSRSKALERLHKQRVIERNGSKRGNWRTKDSEVELMDVFGASESHVNLPLPLGVSEMVKIYPKSIILIAGEQNAGKSAYVSNVIYNIYKKDYVHSLKKELGVSELEVWYFNSEASAEELKSRWSNFEDFQIFRNVKVVSRSNNFQDVIAPDGINIIDYMEIYDNFWEIGTWIRQVYEKLERGIAIICIQKKSGGDMGRGGEITAEKPRLYLSLKSNVPHGGICKIVKAKAFVDPTDNPNGKEIDYKLIQGAAFIETSGWRHMDEKGRERANAEHKLGGHYDPREVVFSLPLQDGGEAGLQRKDFDKWAGAFHNIVVFTELEKIAAGNPWLTREKWFFQLSGYLKKLNSQVRSAA